MTTRSIQRFDHLPQIPKLLKTHNQRTCALLGNEQFNQRSQSLSSTKQTQALRHLRQIYHLERRCFL